jgi:hypothetical protein
MGIFDFFKKKKTPLLDDIKYHSDLIMKAMNNAGYQVDMSVNSLKEIDRFFNEQMDDTLHKPKPGGFLSYDNMNTIFFGIGSLIGEIIIHVYGGEWIVDDNDKYGPVNIAVRLSDGSFIWPVQRVLKRRKEGPENNIYHYAIIANSESTFQY